VQFRRPAIPAAMQENHRQKASAFAIDALARHLQTTAWHRQAARATNGCRRNPATLRSQAPINKRLFARTPSVLFETFCVQLERELDCAILDDAVSPDDRLLAGHTPVISTFGKIDSWRHCRA
jgi:hypothetical protein